MKLEESDMPESDSVPSLFERRNGRRKAIKTRATSEELVKQENENDKVEELNEANMFASSAGRVFRFSGFLESLQRTPHRTHTMDANHTPVSPQESVSPTTPVIDVEEPTDSLTKETDDFIAGLNGGKAFESKFRGRNRMKEKEKLDPFQFFEVRREQCYCIEVTVLCGRNITQGRIADLLDVPDPFVEVTVLGAPDSTQRTTYKHNDVNPEWNQTLKFYCKPGSSSSKIATVKLWDWNHLFAHKVIGSVEIPLDTLVDNGEKVLKTLRFNETSEVDIAILKKTDCFPEEMRYSLALSNEEKNFRRQRKEIAQAAMRRLVPAGGPRKRPETPTIAVLGSGGGFRAMMAFSGAMKALQDTELLDCTTYVSAISGSTWYLSSLYATESFPERGSVKENALDLRERVQHNWVWLLCKPNCWYRYGRQLIAKRKSGQPVTFTDLFGCLVGETLLGMEKMNLKMSSFLKRIEGGKAPLPIFTGVHVRPDVSALSYHEWMEFTPYEVGMARYGTFMSPSYFGSKFYMGHMVRTYEEAPIHFLMGIWGSAFSILINRVMGKSAESPEECSDCKSDEDLKNAMRNELAQDVKSSKLASPSVDLDDEFPNGNGTMETLPGEDVTDTDGIDYENVFKGEDQIKVTEEDGGHLLKRFASYVLGKEVVEGRSIRAGKILNYMRGMTLDDSYPLSPFAAEEPVVADDDEFSQINQTIEVSQKRVHVVDAGLSFNLPFPAVLRPQRTVDLILSFDFGTREKDDSSPFQDLLLAQKWARYHKLPFPKIDNDVFEKEGLKECYVFEDENDERAPIIVHFVLANIDFRKFSRPGKERDPEDTEGDFDVFDESNTYNMMKFHYTGPEFDRIHRLMEFNVLNNIEVIKQQIRRCVTLRRHSTTRCSITLNDIRKSKRLTDGSRRELERRIQKLGRNGSVHLDS